jgi:hypothetical protein
LRARRARGERGGIARRGLTVQLSLSLSLLSPPSLRARARHAAPQGPLRKMITLKDSGLHGAGMPLFEHPLRFLGYIR